MAKYDRILLKLSGEVLGGDAAQGFDVEATRAIVSEVLDAVRTGVQVAIVVGGGNFVRGVNAAQARMDRVTVDSMGMLATVVNALGLADLIRSEGTPSEAMSAAPLQPFAPGYDRRRAIELLEAGGVPVFGGGIGNPYFSTDTTAALRGLEINAGLVAKATKVDGVYDRDPARHPDAKRYEKISYSEVLEQGLAVMDATAVALCRENQLPVLVFRLTDRGAIRRAAAGEAIGTLMS